MYCIWLINCSHKQFLTSFILNHQIVRVRVLFIHWNIRPCKRQKTDFLQVCKFNCSKGIKINATIPPWLIHITVPHYIKHNNYSILSFVLNLKKKGKKQETVLLEKVVILNCQFVWATTKNPTHKLNIPGAWGTCYVGILYIDQYYYILCGMQPGLEPLLRQSVFGNMVIWVY